MKNDAVFDDLEKEFETFINWFKFIPDKEIKTVGNILDMEKYFRSIQNPIIINDIPGKSKQMDLVTSHICDTTNRESLIISCKCGNYRGYYYEGVRCDECNTIVSSNIIDNLENEVWIRIPESIGKVLNPMVYFVFSRILKFGNKSLQNYLDFILNPSSVLPPGLEPYITERGFRYFYENFDYVIDVFVNRFSNTKNRKNIKLLPVFVDKYRDRLFTKYLPIVSKYLQPVMNKRHTNLMYISGSIKDILRSIITLSMNKYIDIVDKSSKTNEKSMWKVYNNYITYYFNLIQTKMSQKRSYFRGHLFGTRLHFTFRNVISPVMGEHIADEIFIPWKTGLTVYMYHLLNILVKRMGYSFIDAYNKIVESYSQYDPEIDQIFQLLILESPFKGLPVLQNRNPGLVTSNIIEHFIMRIEPEITIISKRFIKNFGNIDHNRNFNDSSGKIVYDTRNIRISRKRIVNSNDFDQGKEFDKQNLRIRVIDDIAFDVTKKDHEEKIGIIYDQEKLTKAININSVQVSYLNAKMMNLDYDGDHLNFASILETSMAYYMLQKIHPSNFFIGTSNFGIKPRMHIPRQHIIGINMWLNENEKGE